MITGRDFFDSQTDLTAAKILIYRQYLSSFLPKVLMQYGRCYMADFFCGCGKNGQEDGSPLVLIDIAKTMLDNPTLKAKQPNAEIVIVFSDDDKKCCDDLTSHLSKLSIPNQIKIIGPVCEKFDSIKTQAIKAFDKVKAPKFFFLDPFTYSDVEIDDVKGFMDVPSAEVLLFLPTFHSYRFKSCADQYPKLKTFLDKFTDRGHEDVTDIGEFNEAIRQGLLTYLGLKYVRAIGLDDGARKNALFYLTKHITGMLVMNNLVWKHAHDGLTVKVKKDAEPTLFNLSTVSMNFQKIKEFFQEYIKEKKRVSNTEIISFVAQSCFTTKYVRDILKEMKKQGMIDVEYKRSDKTTGFYVADNHWDEELATIVYRGDKNGE
jgi:three-Cys-motif partner protein